MKNLKDVLKVSFAALSVSLLISTTAMASNENNAGDLQKQFTDRYGSVKIEDQSKLTKKVKLGYAGFDNLKSENDKNYSLEENNTSDGSNENKEIQDLVDDLESNVKEEAESKEKQPKEIESEDNKEIENKKTDNKEIENKKTINLHEDLDEEELFVSEEKVSSEVKALNASGQIEPNRISGKDRYESAAKVSREQFTNAKKVIIVNADKYADALSATTLSEGKYAILYTQKDSLPTATRNEVIRLNPVEIFLLGGRESISAKIESILSNYTDNLTRIAGKDRYETSLEVAKRSSKKNIVIASGENFSDPLYASSYAHKNNAKILLSSKDSLSSATRDYLSKNKSKIGSVTIVGGEKSVSNGNQNSIKSLLSKNIGRIYGLNRYDGSVKVANLMAKDKVIIASGEDFADALIISPLAQKLNAPILLTSSNTLPTEVIAYLNNFKNSIKNVYIIGGQKAVSNNVNATVKNVLKKQEAPKPKPNTNDKPSQPIVPNKAIGVNDFVVAKRATQLYKSPSSGASKVRNISTTAVVQVVSMLKNGWMQLDINGFKGYAKVSDFGMFNPNKYRQIYQQGMDVSKYNGNIDMKRAKKSGIDFVIIKAGSGYSGEDPYFKSNYTKAKAAGINVGAYWYSYAMNVKEAKAEAVRFLKILGNKKFEYPVYFDFEDPSQRNISKKIKTDMAIAFMSTLESAGYYTGLYSSGSWINEEFERDRLKAYDIWIAHWHVTSPVCFTKDYGMWQFTNKSKIDGVPNTGEGGVDMNYSYKNYPTIIKNAHLNNF